MAANSRALFGFGSKREELNLRKSGPLCLNERPSAGRAATSLMGQLRIFPGSRGWHLRMVDVWTSATLLPLAGESLAVFEGLS
jgi:hypothetical protein